MDRDVYIKKLERRIRNQRAQLRWWDQVFHEHVRSRWGRLLLEWRRGNRARYLGKQR